MSKKNRNLKGYIFFLQSSIQTGDFVRTYDKIKEELLLLLWRNTSDMRKSETYIMQKRIIITTFYSTFDWFCWEKKCLSQQQNYIRMTEYLKLDADKIYILNKTQKMANTILAMQSTSLVPFFLSIFNLKIKKWKWLSMNIFHIFFSLTQFLSNLFS